MIKNKVIKLFMLSPALIKKYNTTFFKICLYFFEKI